jgi:hypothetical protein
MMCGRRAKSNPERRAEEARKPWPSASGIAVSALSAGNDFVVLEEEAVRAQVARMKRDLRAGGDPGHQSDPHRGRAAEGERSRGALGGRDGGLLPSAAWSGPSRGASASPSITTATSPTPRASCRRCSPGRALRLPGHQPRHDELPLVGQLGGGVRPPLRAGGRQDVPHPPEGRHRLARGVRRRGARRGARSTSNTRCALLKDARLPGPLGGGV